MAISSNHYLLFAVGLLASVAGCGRTTTDDVRGVPDAGAEHCARGAHAELDRIDTRVPVPLVPMMANHQKQNMREHLVAVQEIVAALAVDDFLAIERSAKRIGFSDQMGRMCSHMGAGAPGFTEQALAFHHTADTVATAAHAKDRAAVARALDATLTTCTACHAAFRQEVVDEATFERLTSKSTPKPHTEVR